MFLNFRHPGNDNLFAAISFSETRRNHKGPNRRDWRVGDHSHIFSGRKFLHWQISVCRRIVRVKEPDLVSPSLRKFSADVLPQTLPNFMAIMLVNRLAWRNKFLMNNVHTLKEDHSWCSISLPSISPGVERMGFTLRGLLGFWVVTVNPRFVFCYDTRETFPSFQTSSNSCWKTNTDASARWWAAEAHRLRADDLHVEVLR
jgi:hypothetical protein